MTIFNKPPKIENIWAASGDMTPPPDNSKINQGFIVEIPLLEQFNYIEYKQDAAIAHINQRGVAEYDSSSSYLALKSYAQGSNGIIYRAYIDNGGTAPAVNPVGDITGTWKVAYYFVSDVYNKTETDATYMKRINNFSDLTNTNTARANLGVYSTGESNAFFMARAANLGDLTNTTVARANLGVYSSGEINTYFMQKNASLSDVGNPAQAFNTIKQQATEGYTGVGRISSDAEANAGVDNTTFLTPRKLRLGFSASIGTFGHISFPTWLSGLILQWGYQTVSGNGQITAALARPFPTACLCGIASWAANTFTDQYAPKGFTSGTNFYINNTNAAAEGVHWFAIGI